MTIRTDLGSRLRDGRQLARTKYKEEEKDKLGILRAGNSGVMTEDGDAAGSCLRVAHLRSLGIETEPPDDSRLIMFQLGTANEDVIYADLVHTKAEDEIILRETEIPISWVTSNGTKVTGRPDMVVLKKVGEELKPSHGIIFLANGEAAKAVFGVEIKSIASVWTSREVLFDGTPKFEHLIQAGHYSWKLGCPFKLMYKQYANQAVPQWANKFFPKKGEKNSEHIEYNDKGEIKAIQPFEIVYELQWNAKVSSLEYRREDRPNDRWVRSPISTADIERFYEFLSTMGSRKELGPRPMTIDAEGREKNFSKCNYCTLKPICDTQEKKGYDAWLGSVKKQLGV